VNSIGPKIGAKEIEMKSAKKPAKRAPQVAEVGEIETIGGA
jgi:hypothetical protein